VLTPANLRVQPDGGQVCSAAIAAGPESPESMTIVTHSLRSAAVIADCVACPLQARRQRWSSCVFSAGVRTFSCATLRWQTASPSGLFVGEGGVREARVAVVLVCVLVVRECVLVVRVCVPVVRVCVPVVRVWVPVVRVCVVVMEVVVVVVVAPVEVVPSVSVTAVELVDVVELLVEEPPPPQPAAASATAATRAPVRRRVTPAA
jgi:hypothetical protein